MHRFYRSEQQPTSRETGCLLRCAVRLRQLWEQLSLHTDHSSVFWKYDDSKHGSMCNCYAHIMFEDILRRHTLFTEQQSFHWLWAEEERRASFQRQLASNTKSFPVDWYMRGSFSPAHSLLSRNAWGISSESATIFSSVLNSSGNWRTLLRLKLFMHTSFPHMSVYTSCMNWGRRLDLFKKWSIHFSLAHRHSVLPIESNVVYN